MEQPSFWSSPLAWFRHKPEVGINVLVLCQRKTDIHGKELVNDLIQNLTERILKTTHFSITYVSDLSIYKIPQFKDQDGTVDFDGKFGNNRWTRETFKQHSYDLIILNTCPLMAMDIDYVHHYLKDGGILAIATYLSDKQLEKRYRDIDQLKSIGYQIHSKDYVEIDRGIPDAILYQKVIRGGKRKIKKTKKVFRK